MRQHTRLNSSQKSSGFISPFFLRTSPTLSKELDTCLDGVQTLVFDLTDLEYISSSGLRVFLSAQKAMNKKGSMIVKNASEMVMEIFDITGFVDILTIE